MAETSLYFEAITAQRSLLLNQDEALEGNTNLSLETNQEDSGYNFSDYVQDSFPDFIRHIRKLPKREQEILLSYYLLRVCQTRLAKIHRTTQTLASQDIRRGASAMTAILLFGGDAPSAKRMAPVLKKAGEEIHTITSVSWGKKPTRVNASELIAEFAVTRSYNAVAEKFQLFRPEVRRLLRGLADRLPLSEHTEIQALGCWLAVLTEHSSAKGSGYTERQAAKFAHIYKKDSPLLGEFRIDVTHPDFDEMFCPHADL